MKYIALVLLKTENLITLITSYDETILCIEAENEEMAKKLAYQYGKDCETMYQNNLGQNIRVSFLKIIDVNRQLQDENEVVTELYSRHFCDIKAYADFEVLYNENAVIMGKTKAKIYSKTQEIGEAVLSVGDFTMGGIVGEFYPNEYYITQIQPLVWKFWDNYNADPSSFFSDKLQLEVQLENGLFLLPLGGIFLEDFLDKEPTKRLEMSGVDTFFIENYILENQPLTLKNNWQTLCISEKKSFEQLFRKANFKNGFENKNFSAIFKNQKGEIAFEIAHLQMQKRFCIVAETAMTNLQEVDFNEFIK